LSTLYSTDIYHNNSDDDYRFGVIFTFDSNLGSPTPYSLSITKPGGGAVNAETSGTYGPQTFGSSGKTNRLAFFIKAFNSDNDPGLVGSFNYTLTYTPTAGKSYPIKQGSFKVENPLLLGGDATHPSSPFPTDGSASFTPGTPQTITIKDASPNQHYALFLPTGSLSGYVFNTPDTHKSGDLNPTIDVGQLNPAFGEKNTLCLTNNGFDTGALQKLKDAGKGILNFVTFGLFSAVVGELPFTPSDNMSMYCTWSVKITVNSAPSPTPTPTPPLPPCLQYEYNNAEGTPIPLKSSIDDHGNFTIPSHNGGTPYPYRCAQVNTIFGAFDTDASGFIAKIFTIILSISGGIVIASIIYAGYRILTSNGNPETLKAGRERLTGAIIGLLFIIFSLVLLQFIGVDILGLPGFGK